MIALALLLAAAGPIVGTGYGPVRGEALAGGGAVFRGIRFAMPPVGALRWRPPQPPARWTAPVDAGRDHKACPQPVYGDWNKAASANADEDCLFLDVRTPSLQPRAALPVLVWIHGGGNRAGAGSGTVESSITGRGIVLVSIQYRLGALGFMSHPALSAEQGGASGNYGLMDQQRALAWVQRNIARFGGDPRRVTIAGESAGAQDVGLHLLSPGSHGLFARAIAESGTPGFGVPPRTLRANEALGEAIVARAGAGRDASAAALRRLPVSAVIAAQEAVEVPGLDDKSFIWLAAVIDGRVLREPPAQSLAAGRTNPAALIIGVNAQEFTGYQGWKLAPVIAREFGARAPAVTAAYARTDDRLGDAAMQLGTDLVFRCPTVAVSGALARHGGAVWQYQFDYAPPGETVKHGSEVRYVFDRPDAGAPPLQAYWTNFVRTGDPNGEGVPRWPRYTITGRNYLSFDQFAARPAADLRGEMCRGRDAP